MRSDKRPQLELTLGEYDAALSYRSLCRRTIDFARPMNLQRLTAAPALSLL
jgi:hypothetical protein